MSDTVTVKAHKLPKNWHIGQIALCRVNDLQYEIVDIPDPTTAVLRLLPWDERVKGDFVSSWF